MVSTALSAPSHAPARLALTGQFAADSQSIEAEIVRPQTSPVNAACRESSAFSRSRKRKSFKDWADAVAAEIPVKIAKARRIRLLTISVLSPFNAAKMGWT